jgi:hypothetical protein
MLFEWLASNHSAGANEKNEEKSNNYVPALNSNGNGSATKFETFVATENGKH